MDISPLPHKAPFSFLTTERELPSPTPEATLSTNDDMLSPCELPPPPQFPLPEIEVPRPVSAAEYVFPCLFTMYDADLSGNRRRKPPFMRPGLARSKNYSTNTVSLKSRERDSPFRFSAGFDNTSPTLDECFTASPPHARPMSNPLLGASKPRPVSFNVRKPSAGPARRPSKFRRSNSMFEHPGDVVNAKQDKDNYTPSGLQSVMDVDDSPSLKIPHFTQPNEPDSLPRITDATLIDILNGEYNHLYDQKYIIDCRFEYEYNGGHIDGAQNFCEKDKLSEHLFGLDAPTNASNTLLILHCEYSAHRAPLM